MRKNFIPGENEVSIIYEDSCGHGTSAAGIIAAKDNEDGITGINPNVELYSAKVLDSNLSAPISRVVEAIYWAIDNEVNIINISFGTVTDSAALKLAIQDAYAAGILLIAAAGNNLTIEYPAAYDEVIAVGSVDSMGERSQYSATGEDLELMAPGELILSTGDFGGVSVSSGTSMAAPHVTGIASILWQKDISCSNDFIRSLLDLSANKYGDSVEYGYGLIDLEYALEQYDVFKNLYVDNQPLDFIIEEEKRNDGLLDNTNEVIVFDDVDYVKGSWATDKHALFAELGALSDGALVIVKLGAKANDIYIPSHTTNPQWHGYGNRQDLINGTWKTLYYSNYMGSYIYITQMALVFTNDTSIVTTVWKDPSPTYNMIADDLNNLKGKVSIGSVLGKSWSEALAGKAVTDRNKRLFVYGLALHTATDVFAHNTYKPNGEMIDHTKVNDVPNADNEGYIPNRDTCAQTMAKMVIGHIKSFTVGSLEDFYTVANTVYDKKTFYIPQYNGKANLVDSVYYNSISHKSAFDIISTKPQQ